jgi:hypothetical protein
MAVVAGSGLVLKGANGTAGTNGTNGTNGISHILKSGAPQASDGTGQPTGSTYQVLENGELYTWNGTAWSDTGYTARGSQIFNGTGAFAAANYPKAVAGLDYYLQTDTATLYPLVNG